MAAITTSPHQMGTTMGSMKTERAILRWTGAFGLGAAVLLMITGPFYASMGAPPSLSNGDALTAYMTQNQVAAITTKLIDAFYVMGLIVFAAGLRHLIRRADESREWVAALTFGLALITSAIILFGDVLGAAAALDTYGTPDASVIRALTEASLPAFGAVCLISTAAFLFAAGGSILAAGGLPYWTGWTALATAAVNLVAAPTIYGGGDFLWASIAAGGTAGPYSYAVMVAGLALTFWQGAVGIAMIWRGRARSSATAA